MPSTRQSGQRGFSLIEVMITVAIVGILTTVAMTLYSAQVQKSRRTDARTALLDIAGREERFFSVANNYSLIPSDVGYGGGWPQVVANGYYSVNVSVPDPAFVAAGGVGPSFVVTATPVGLQLPDTACASFTVNQLGKQAAVNSGGADSTATCWN